MVLQIMSSTSCTLGGISRQNICLLVLAKICVCSRDTVVVTVCVLDLSVLLHGEKEK